MLKIIISFFLFSSIGHNNSAGKDSMLTKEMYSVINFFIENHEVTFLQQKPLPFLFEEDVKHDQLRELNKFFLKIDSTKLESLFSDMDYVFMRDQLKIFKKLKWNSAELTRNVVVLNKKDLRKRTIKSSEEIFNLSVPLFNKELNKAMLFIIIDFVDSSAGFFYLLSKKDALWREDLFYPYFIFDFIE